MDSVAFAENTLINLLRHRAIDWLCAILLASVIVLLEYGNVFKPYERYYLPKNESDNGPFDPTINYPHATSETVPTSQLFFIIGLPPIASAFITQAIKLYFDKTWNWKLDLHNFLLAFFQALSTSQFVTSSLKIYAGRHRPDFYGRLETGIAEEIDDGMRSFPSGHASSAFMAMSFIALYLSGKCRLVGSNKGFSIFIFTVILPLSVAAVVAVSRTRDYVHNFSDINAGAFIGIFSSTCCYFINFHSILGPRADEAYGIPSSPKSELTTIEAPNL